MECVPKLFPMWHELGYKSIMKHKNFRFANSKLPDYGGMGIDMILDGAEIKWNVLKHSVDQTGFKANLCALPFIPANKVETLDDPCLEPVKEKKANIKKFCIKLESLRKSVNSRGKERYKDEILSLYKKIKKMSNLGQFEKILIPEYIVQLANEIPEQVFCPDINFSYAGGCLTTSKRLDNKYVLLYSTGRKFDRLGEKPSADTEVAQLLVNEIIEFSNSEKLPRKQIYSADRTGLFLQYVFRNTLAASTEKAPAGKKSSKARITILARENAAGMWKSMTTLEENHEPYKCLRAVETVNVKLKRGNILQVVSNFNGICYVRQKDRCHYVNFINPFDVTQNECLKKSGLLYICASSYIPEELVTISKNGELELYNIEISQTLWDLNTSFHKDVLETDLWSCSFGSHPKSVLCLNEKRLCSFDLRCEKSVSAEMFSSNHSSCFINEKLLLTKELKINSFQHVITSNNHLFLIDERYPNKPVMLWNHMLKDYPIYCDIATYQTTATSSDAVILLGTQEEREMMAFFLKSSLSQVQPQSLGPPFLLSSPSDCINSLKLHFINIDDKVARRFKYPLTGLCSVPNHQKCTFTAFQLTSLGDLFYQDFETTESDFVNNSIERTYHFGIGCVLSPPEKISPYLTDWIESSCVTKEDTSLNTELTRVNVDLTDMLSIPDEISTDCILCRCSNSHRDKSLLTLDPCPSCGLSSVYSQQLSEASTNLGVLIGPVLTNTDLSNFDVADLSQFTDPFSKRLLDVWLEVDDFNHSQETIFQDVNMESLALHSSLKTPHNVSSLSTNWDSSMTPSLSLEATSMTNIQPSSCLQNTFADFGSQNITDELIPPSQDARPLIGETVRTPKDLKLMINKRVKSVTGF